MIENAEQAGIGLEVNPGQLDGGQKKADLAPARALEHLADGFEPIAGVDPFADPARRQGSAGGANGALHARDKLGQGVGDIAGEIQPQRVASEAEEFKQAVAGERADAGRGVFVLRIGEDGAPGAHTERAKGGRDGKTVVVGHHPGGALRGLIARQFPPEKLARVLGQHDVGLEQAEGGFAIRALQNFTWATGAEAPPGEVLRVVRGNRFGDLEVGGGLEHGGRESERGGRDASACRVADQERTGILVHELAELTFTPPERDKGIGRAPCSRDPFRRERQAGVKLTQQLELFEKEVESVGAFAEQMPAMPVRGLAEGVIGPFTRQHDAAKKARGGLGGPKSEVEITPAALQLGGVTAQAERGQHEHAPDPAHLPLRGVFVGRIR